MCILHCTTGPGEAAQLDQSFLGEMLPGGRKEGKFKMGWQIKLGSWWVGRREGSKKMGDAMGTFGKEKMK